MTEKPRSSSGKIIIAIALTVVIILAATGYTYLMPPTTTTTTTTQTAGINRVIFQEQDEYGPRQLAIMAGDVDSIYVPATNAFDFVDKDAWLNERMLVNTKEGISLRADTSLAVSGMQMNFKWKSGDFTPFANKDFRYAFCYAFDYTTYINTVANGFADQGRGPIPQGLLPYPDLFQFSYNPDMAKEYFGKAKDAGAFNEGLKMTIYYNSGNEARKQGSLLLKDGIEKLDAGISVTVQELDWPTFLAKMRSKELPILFVAWAPDYADPDDYAVPFCHGEYGTHAINIGYNNPEVNRMIEEAAIERDAQKRVELYKAVERQVVEDAPYIWISEPMAITCQRDWVKGWFYNSMYGDQHTTPLAYGMYKDPAAPNPDTFTHATIGDVDSMDPAWDYESFGGSVIELTLERLVYYDREKLAIVPQLAKGWDVSDDGLVYTFHINDKAKFNDGTPITAHAVKFSLDRLVLMNDPDGPAWMFSSYVKGGPEYMTANTWQVTNETEVQKYLAAEGVKAIDDLTVQITLEQPFAPFVTVLAYTACSILNPAMVNANEVDQPGFHNEWVSKHGPEIGSGPFKLVEWTPKQSIVLERNENYWNLEQMVPKESQNLSDVFALPTVPENREIKDL